MLAPAASLKHQLSKERAFPPRTEILAEMLRPLNLVKGRAPASVGSGLISNILSTTPLRMDGEEARLI
jgi:hypothetical protein